MHFQVGYLGMVMRNCVKSARVSAAVAAILATLALVFGFEFLFGRADIGALVAIILIVMCYLICWSGRAG